MQHAPISPFLDSYVEKMMGESNLKKGKTIKDGIAKEQSIKLISRVFFISILILKLKINILGQIWTFKAYLGS